MSLQTVRALFGRRSSDDRRREGSVLIGYKGLEVYQRAYKMAKEVHQITQTFPVMERRELGSQLRRASVSIVLNIAEGYGRKDSQREFQYFLRNALGSCNEVRVLLELIRDIGYLTEPKYLQIEEQYEIVGKQLYRLRERNKS